MLYVMLRMQLPNRSQKAKVKDVCSRALCGKVETGFPRKQCDNKELEYVGEPGFAGHPLGWRLPEPLPKVAGKTAPGFLTGGRTDRRASRRPPCSTGTNTPRRPARTWRLQRENARPPSTEIYRSRGRRPDAGRGTNPLRGRAPAVEVEIKRRPLRPR